MALVKLRIKAGEGRHVYGHGSQEKGAIIEVESELARALIEDDPQAYEVVKDTPPQVVKSEDKGS